MPDQKLILKKARGFSLIELLVVIAIIATIAAIAIPILLSARRTANTASAMQTLRNLSTAQVTYSLGIGKGNYTTDLSNLGGTRQTDVCMFDDTVTESTTVPKSGYLLGWVATIPATSTAPAKYKAVIYPENAAGFTRTGNDVFYVDDSGVIRHSGSPVVWPDAKSPEVK